MKNSDTANIKKYWLNFRKKMIIVPILEYLTLFSGMILLESLREGPIFTWNFFKFWVILTLIWIFFQIVQRILFIKPQKIMLDIIINQSFGKQIAKNPQISKYKNSGLGSVLAFLYSRDSKNPKEEKPISEFSNLDESQVGIVVLDEKNKIVYKNVAAPNLQDLSFTNQITPQDWLDKIREHKIYDNKLWKRIPEIQKENKNQRFFDIEVDFRKSNQNRAILFFIEKSHDYLEDENDLNFIAFAAHELRGPITIIRGYLDILSAELENKISKQHKELFDRLIVSGNKLSGYINNILNVSRLDQNRLTFDISEHPISDIIDSSKEDIVLRATSQARNIEIDIPENLPTVGTDLSGISEAFVNLVDNAIKYSNEGGLVKISAKQADDFVELSVQDFGIGIPANVMANLFQKFYRSHRSRETVAGTGIGLYISQAIVRKIGGNISVTSVEGEGSTFTISIPTFESVKNSQKDENNIVKQPGGGWIKNHGRIK